jgi:hypothetical protein
VSQATSVSEVKPQQLRYFGKVFGEDLHVVVKREGGSIPQVVEMLTQFLDQHGTIQNNFFNLLY